MIFANPPLVELIAELRWVPGVFPTIPASAEGGPGQVVMQIPITSPEQEEGFSRFSNKAAERGFSRSERVVPVGFPTPPFTVVYRFRKPMPAGENYLYQIGVGLFSANALPPYRNWDGFRPIVQEGVQAVLESQSLGENNSFTRVSLRYIDLFSEEFTEGNRSFRFLTNVLGVKLELPDTLKEQILDIDGVNAGIQLSAPLTNGLTMSLYIQDGTAAGKPGIVMSIEVLTTQSTPPEVSQVMQMLENAHTSIRAAFVGLTEKLNSKMQPVQ